MKRLLVICGPTATGKTSLAISLAKKFNGEIISADSRQVYKGMNIGTGKDLPKNSKLEIRNSKLGGSYKVAGVSIWGYDIADPKKGFSVGQYIKIARMVVENIWARGRLPILMGGTGLYIKGVVDGIPTANIRPNIKLRKSLAEKNTDELFETLATIDPLKAASLNQSDRQNPRRLIRAIEVGLRAKQKNISMNKLIDRGANVLFIGLWAPKDNLFERIKARVDERIRAGIEKEIKTLLSGGIKWKSQAMDSLGYRGWEGYFKKPNEISKEVVALAWKTEEHKYAKRQMTWFKKDKRIEWFDISRLGFGKSIENLVQKWYSNGDVSKN